MFAKGRRGNWPDKRYTPRSTFNLCFDDPGNKLKNIDENIDFFI